MNFADLELNPDILRAVADAGYTQPTPIQAQAIPHVLMGRDVLGCAQTGTGKTASFTLPMIDILAAGRSRARMPRSLILEPTRELATQVQDNFEVYGRYTRLSTALLIGGESMVDQGRLLDRGVDVLIATPGRLIDLFERGQILLNDVKILVIDEADRMLDMGFIPDIERIVGVLPPLRQTLFFSATMPREIRVLADRFLSNPREITVAPPASPAATVSQFLIRTTPDKKRATLRALITSEEVTNALIFCNRKRDVDILNRSLRRHGFNVGCLHGDMPQSARTETLESFRKGDITFLVASDVAARGLDIDRVSHVFNFDVPFHAEDYVHRIGRTGRAGRSGRAITLVTGADGKFLDQIEQLIGRKIDSHEKAAALAGGEGPEDKDSGGEPSSTAPSVEERGAEGGRKGTGRQRRRGGRKDQPAQTKPAKTGTYGTPGAKDQAARASAAPSPSDRGKKKDSGEAGGAVKGLGDHVPAFLMKQGR